MSYTFFKDSSFHNNINKRHFILYLKKKILESLEEYNVVVAHPSSGSTFARLVLQSYLELISKNGNSIPKYI